MYRTVGAEQHDDFESSTRGVEHYNRAETSRDKDTWWWNDKVQEVIKAKKESMKMWETSVRQIATGRQTRRANKDATKAVAQPRREQ